jgi:hypothetical protein
MKKENVTENFASKKLQENLTRKNASYFGQSEISLIGLIVIAINSNFKCCFCSRSLYNFLEIYATIEHHRTLNNHRLDFSTIFLACHRCNSMKRDDYKTENMKFNNLPCDSEIIEAIKNLIALDANLMLSRYITNKSNSNYTKTWIKKLIAKCYAELLADKENFENRKLETSIELRKDFEANEMERLERDLTEFDFSEFI